MPDDGTTRRAVLAGGAVVLGGGIVYGATRSSDRRAPATPSFHATDATTGYGVALAGAPVAGSLDAPIDLYYWSDYQCPFCRQFERETLPELLDREVGSGDVRLAFLSFPYLGPGSRVAAIAAKCVWRNAADDGRAFWAWHTRMFERQRENATPGAMRSHALDIARGVAGLDADAVASCMDEEDAIAEDIASEVAKARSLGFEGSPSFAAYHREADVSGRLVGAQPYERFEEAFRRLRE
ncbi:DsbA family protein [Halobacteriaceae archaeon GCM10025711]